MSYVNAPATRMLATHCGACALPLVDSKSVEAGMGPDCRKKYGRLLNELPEEARKAANILIHRLALEQTGVAALTTAVELRMLGFDKLAARVVKRCADINIDTDGPHLLVRTPYSEEANLAWRGVGYWDRDRKARVVRTEARPALWALLLRFFRGAVGVGPKGVFTVAEDQA